MTVGFVYFLVQGLTYVFLPLDYRSNIAYFFLHVSYPGLPKNEH